MAEMMSLAKRQDELEKQIDVRMPKLVELVPKSGEMVRLKRAFLMACTKTPKLLECSAASLLGSLVECAQLGLMPGASQEAAIIPFKGVATFVPMYQGLLKLVYRGGQVAWVKAEIVYEKDQFEYREESDRTVLAHIPTEDDDPGELRAVYIKVKTRDEPTPMLGVMYRRDILKHRERSAAWRNDGNSPWHTDPEAMWKKTIIRVYSKYLPKSEDGALSRAIALDEMADRGEPQGLETGVPAPDLVPREEVTLSGKVVGDNEALRKHLFAFAGEHMLPDEDNRAALHDVAEPLGFESVNDIPIERVDEIKQALVKRAASDAVTI